MCFNGNDSKENDNEVRIQWRVADIKIPNNEIKIFHKTKTSMPFQTKMVKKFHVLDLHLGKQIA